MKKVKRWMKYRRVRALVERAARDAFYMNHWGRMHNLYDRLDRVMGNLPQYRLRNYMRFKRMLAADASWPGEWLFDPYTLT